MIASHDILQFRTHVSRLYGDWERKSLCVEAYPGTQGLIEPIRGHRQSEALQAFRVNCQSADKVGNRLTSWLLRSICADVDADMLKELHVLCVDWEESKHSGCATSSRAEADVVQFVKCWSRFRVILAACEQNLPRNSDFAIKLLPIEGTEFTSSAVDWGHHIQELLKNH
jgi:hypothetical protein